MLTKNAADSDSMFQTKGSKTFGKTNNKNNKHFQTTLADLEKQKQKQQTQTNKETHQTNTYFQTTLADLEKHKSKTHKQENKNDFKLL